MYSIEFDAETMIQLITWAEICQAMDLYAGELAPTVVMTILAAYFSRRCSYPIFDAIFTRIGAADDLISGQSTFMVEMMEANQPLSCEIKKSLILFDELVCWDCDL